MADYIDIDTPIDVAVYQRNRRIQVTLRQILDSNDAKYQPADVRPVVRAEFVRCGDGKGVPYMCSHCGRTTPANMVEIWGVNYCPNCGARMEES